MELVTPDIGLIFWTTLVFLVLLFILTKFAWRPILNAVKEREKNIEQSLASAEKAKEEIAALQAKNEDLLIEARKERDKLLASARETADQMVAEAKNTAKAEGEKIIASAREAIRNERKVAIEQIKSEVTLLSVELAEKILKNQLDSNQKHEELINAYVREIELN